MLREGDPAAGSARERVGDPDEFERALAACLDRYAELGPRAIDEACASHPTFATRLRERVESLARLGLLGDAAMPRAFGRYTLVRKLGEGGMGVVYLARDAAANREVALKIARFALGSDDRARARFEREIRAFGQLAHACVVPVLDVGEVDGRPYFAMEYVAGATLARVIEELQSAGLAFEALTTEHVRRIVGSDDSLDSVSLWGRTYVETVCRLVLDLTSALAHAHEHGIVHRDVKPSNVLVRRDGRALVFDLGLAHLADQPSLTRSGDFTGTPYYVSPEQIAARPGEIDRRTDVYSLGVTLYELLALRRPFEGPNSVRVLRRIQSGEPTPLRKLNPAVPRDLETICATAMERSRERRYPSMDEFARDLRAFLAFRPVRAKPVGIARRLARRARGNPLLSAVLALGVIVALGVPIGLLWANAAIREERDRASAAANQARGQARLSAAQNDFLVGLFELAESRKDDATAAIELLDRGVERLNQRNDLEPLARAALLEAAARGYVKLGRDDRALPLFDRAFAMRHRELGENHVDVARLLCELASVHLREHNADSALALAQRGVAAFENCGAARTFEAARCRRVLGDASLELRQLELAQSHFDAALDVLNALNDASDELALVHEGLGELAQLRGQLDAAAERYGYALALQRARSSPDAKAIARTLERLAAIDELRGRAAVATRRRAEASELLRASGSPAAVAPPTPAPLANEASLIDFAPPWRAEFEREFQAGITALQTGAHAQAIERFTRCRELSPHQPVAAYNIACAHALAGETDAALTWLATAVDDGFAYSDERFDIARKDADLGRLRSDPRFAALLARMEEQRSVANAYAAEPASYVPAGEPPERGWPVLIVLHDHGSTKDELVRGPWRAIADDLGAILVAPSGAIPTDREPVRGMAWIEDLAAFVEAPPAIEQRVRAALDATNARQHVDARRVLLAGEGQAAPLAFDLAVHAPGLFRGVLLHNGPPHVAATSEDLRTAASIGIGVGVALDVDAQVPGAGGASADKLVDDLAAWFANNHFRSARAVELTRADVAPQLAELARALLR